MICTLLRKPLIGGGGILNALPCAVMNIDATRVPTIPRRTSIQGNFRSAQNGVMLCWGVSGEPYANPPTRYPTNVLVFKVPSLLDCFPWVPPTDAHSATFFKQVGQ